MKRTLFAALLVGAGVSIMAGSGPYFDTYTHHMDVGEWELEVGVDAVRAPGGGWTYGQALEIEHGFNEHFAASLYLLGTWDPRSAATLDGYKLETRYRPWTKNCFWVPTFYLEYEQFHHPETYRDAAVGFAETGGSDGPFRTEHELEGRLIFSQDFDWGNVALNLVAEKPMNGEPFAFGYTGGFFIKGPSSGVEGGASFDPDGDGDSHFLYGVEFFGNLGVSGEFGLYTSRQEHYAEPFAALPLNKRLTLKTGVAIGLNAQSEDRIRAVLVVRLGRLK
jgi:hypothetical protein